MHPDSSHAWIYEKLRLQLYSYHARTENSENSTFTYSLNLSSIYLYRYLLLKIGTRLRGKSVNFVWGKMYGEKF